MKKIVIAVLFLIMLSCESDKLYCWYCETTSGDQVISKITTCGMTEDNMRDFQAGVQTQASVNLKCCAETICYKKE